MHKNILARLASCGQSEPALTKCRALVQKTGTLVHYR